MTRHRLLVTCLALVAAACSGSGVQTTLTTAAPTTTEVPSTSLETTTTTAAPDTSTTTYVEVEPTTTTIATGPTSPVNGLSSDEALLDRRAITVKIDNHPDARPQSGIQEADGMIEILVEGGFTRFIAVFHDSDSEYVGPIRSVRPTDSTIIPVLEAPLATSGGQRWVQDLLVSRGVNLIGETTAGLFRIRSRQAPQNLYGNTTDMRVTADGRNLADTAPPWLFQLGAWDLPDRTATEITMRWSGETRVVWKYQDGVYTRWNGSRPHNWVAADGTTGQITADVLVVLEGTLYTARPASGSGDPVPATETIGTGDAMVFAFGRVWQGTWSREDITDPFTLRDADGTVVVVPAGVPWVSIFPSGRDISFS